ncbi:exopolysaccharide biosynthesis polyprenyl glycosylphosphotransferase [Sporohalobacter salinus]|uniref:exopolysaccharide biosynthesis polyprenyl glycosylphosphotransferase n=1 Tax=Sporohalobacter salinus TaxID=1494606 RepID=UPI001962210E|nr:exopolysaccharide biosynthesis polyprenyl glycosylphosphotransferase [Sporohalobacter salinus]
MAKSESEVIGSQNNRVVADSKAKKKSLSYQLYLTNKRSIDIVGSIVGLILSLPIMVLTAIAIKLESSGPIIFKQTRMGLYGEEFTIYKFRSMVANAEKKTGPVWAKENDSRITRVGEFIRRTRIDELPQFVNILKGDMSLVGPRPERAVFVEEFTKEYPQFKDRLYVRPGVTGLAQVTGGYELSPHQKARLDLLYIEKQGLLLDIKILFKTILVIIFGEGAR